jgi:hypothetical protein
MTLPLSEKRCAGRLTVKMGQPTLCVECLRCARRTEIPADVQSVTFMGPPKLLWTGTCSGYRYEGEAEIAE